MDLVSKELRAKYRFTALGFLWVVLEPLMMTLVLTFVVTIVFDIRFSEGETDSSSNAVLILCAYLFWKFIADSLGRASTSLVDNKALINKVNFPKEIIPLSSVGLCLVNLAIGFIIFVAIHLALGGRVTATYAWLPLVFGIELVIVTGLALILSAYNATYRDVSVMVGVGLVIGFYGTPVFYPLKMVQDKLVSLAAGQPELAWLPFAYFANPAVGIITCLRQILVEGVSPDFMLLVWPALFGLFVMMFGVIVFRRKSGTMADTL